MRDAAFPSPPSLFFPGSNRDTVIKFPLPGVGSSCAQTSSAAEGDRVFTMAAVEWPQALMQPSLPMSWGSLTASSLASYTLTQTKRALQPLQSTLGSSFLLALFWESWGLSKQSSLQRITSFCHCHGAFPSCFAGGNGSDGTHGCWGAPICTLAPSLGHPGQVAPIPLLPHMCAKLWLTHYWRC